MINDHRVGGGGYIHSLYLPTHPIFAGHTQRNPPMTWWNCCHPADALKTRDFKVPPVFIRVSFIVQENSLRNWMKTFFVTNCDLNQTIVSCFIYIMIRNRKDFKVNFFLHFLFSNHEGRKKTAFIFFWPT